MSKPLIAITGASSGIGEETARNFSRKGYENLKEGMGGFLEPSDVADAIMYACRQPDNVCVREIVLAPTKQLT